MITSRSLRKILPFLRRVPFNSMLLLFEVVVVFLTSLLLVSSFDLESALSDDLAAKTARL